MPHQKTIELLSNLSRDYPAHADELIRDFKLTGEVELREILSDIGERGIALVIEEADAKHPLQVRVRADCWSTAIDLVNRMSVLLV